MTSSWGTYRVLEYNFDCKEKEIRKVWWYTSNEEDYELLIISELQMVDDDTATLEMMMMMMMMTIDAAAAASAAAAAAAADDDDDDDDDDGDDDDGDDDDDDDDDDHKLEIFVGLKTLYDLGNWRWYRTLSTVELNCTKILCMSSSWRFRTFNLQYSNKIWKTDAWVPWQFQQMCCLNVASD